MNSMTTRFALVLAAVVVITGCGASERSGGTAAGDRPGAVVETGSDTQALLTSAGFDVSTVPGEPRQRPLVLAMDDSVLVFGGFNLDGPVQVNRNDGQIFRVKDKDWTPIEEGPFSSALYQASAVWTGEVAVVLGRPCAKTVGDVDHASCNSSELQVGAYSPRSNTWIGVRTIEGSEPSKTGSVFESLAVGAGPNGEALFRAGNGPHAGELLVVSSDLKNVDWVEVSPQVDSVCAVNGRVVSVTTGQIDPDGTRTVPNPRANLGPLSTAILDFDRMEWSSPVELPKPDPVDDIAQNVVCSGGALAYFGMRATSAPGVLWYNADKGAWDRAPALEFGTYPMLTVAEVPAGRFVWSSGGNGRTFTLERGKDEWSLRQVPEVGSVGLQPLGSDLLLDVSYQTRPPSAQFITLIPATNL